MFQDPQPKAQCGNVQGFKLVPKEERSSGPEMLVPGADSPLGQKLCGRHGERILVENHVEPAPSPPGRPGSQKNAVRESQFSVCGETEAQGDGICSRQDQTFNI